MKYHLIFFLSCFCTSAAWAQQGDSTLEEILQYSTDNYTVDDNSSEYNTEVSHTPVDPSGISQKNGYATQPIRAKRFNEKEWNDVVGGTDYSEEQRIEKKKRQRRDSLRASEGSAERSNQPGADGKKKRVKRNYSQEEDDEDDEEEADVAGSSSPIESTALTYVFYALIIGAIAYILFLVLKNVSLKAKDKKLATDTASPDQVTDIKELEIDRLLREALASGDYRLAIRICFLGLLKKLDEDGFIAWKKDKTNREYLSELFAKEHYYEPVRKLTLAYEEVWYGDHTFSKETYETIISSFRSINQELNASPPR